MNFKSFIEFKSNRSRTVTSILKSANIRRKLSNKTITKEMINKCNRTHV